MAHDGLPLSLDIAFALDCTISMVDYIRETQEFIQTSSESLALDLLADINFALVEYRDHTYDKVTSTHDFTSSLEELKNSLVSCITEKDDDNDVPKAVADALHAIQNLNWREDSTKICILITDAPPHGLISNDDDRDDDDDDDDYPNGCPDGHDPMVISSTLAQKGIAVYVAGCEPGITEYKDWFKAITLITGGQYVPLEQAEQLVKFIKGCAEEELSLRNAQRIVHKTVQLAFTSTNAYVRMEPLIARIHKLLEVTTTTHLVFNGGEPSDLAKELAKCTTMKDAIEVYKTYDDSQCRKATNEIVLVSIDTEERTITREQVERMVFVEIRMNGLTIPEPINKSIGTENIPLSTKGTGTDIVYAVKATNTNVTSVVKSTNTERVPDADKAVNTDPMQRCPFKILHSYSNGCPFFPRTNIRSNSYGVPGW